MTASTTERLQGKLDFDNEFHWAQNTRSAVTTVIKAHERGLRDIKFQKRAFAAAKTVRKPEDGGWISAVQTKNRSQISKQRNPRHVRVPTSNWPQTTVFVFKCSEHLPTGHSTAAANAEGDDWITEAVQNNSADSSAAQDHHQHPISDCDPASLNQIRFSENALQF